MSDLTLEILMGVVLVGVVLRMSLRGNTRPGLFVAVGCVLISVAGMIRHLELSDIIIPLVVAAISGAIAAMAARGRSKAQAD